MALKVITWDTDLMAYVTSVLGEPFEWGRTDCASIVRGAVAAMYGRDVLKVRKYKTPLGARRALELKGSYRKALERVGAEEVPFRFRQRGDVAIFSSEEDIEGFPGLGVVVHGGIVTVGPDETVQLVPVDGGATDIVIMRIPNG